MAIYKGGCHCGAVRFEVEGEIADVAVCNCSICAKTAYLHWHVQPKQFKLLTTEAAIRNYQFGTMTSKNYFCESCGISPFRHSRTEPELFDINLRCIDDLDVDAFPTALFDGQNWEEAVKR